MKQELHPLITKRLLDIFIKKRWSYKSEDYENKENKFDLFCDLLGRLEPDQIELMLKLTELFEHYPLNSYFYFHRELVSKTISYFDFSELAMYDAIIMSPLKAEGSAPWVFFPFVHEIKDIRKFPRDKIIERSSPDKIDEFINKRDLSSVLIILTDDFIGTGDTAFKAIKSIKSLLNENINICLFFMSFIVQRHGLMRLRNAGYNVIFVKEHTKGISESGVFENPEIQKEIMRCIEKKLKRDKRKQYSLGYKRSEATISMIKTPNNTFPVFWCVDGKYGKRWPAPFPRFDKSDK